MKFGGVLTKLEVMYDKQLFFDRTSYRVSLYNYNIYINLSIFICLSLGRIRVDMPPVAVYPGS